MSDRTRQVIEAFVEALNRHDAAAAAQLLAEDVRMWEPTYDQPLRGRDTIRRELEGFLAMLPDICFTTERIVADGEQAVHEWRYRASYAGRPVEMRECAVLRFDEAGQVAEARVYFDRLSLLRQLGLLAEDEVAGAS